MIYGKQVHKSFKKSSIFYLMCSKNIFKLLKIFSCDLCVKTQHTTIRKKP